MIVIDNLVQVFRLYCVVLYKFLINQEEPSVHQILTWFAMYIFSVRFIYPGQSDSKIISFVRS